MSIGERIRRAREWAKLTQEQTAELLGLSTAGAISHFETGTREPSITQLMNMARVYDVSPNWLLTGTPPSKGENKIPVLAIQWRGESRTLYLDSLEDIQRQLEECFLGEIGEWKDYVGEEVTIRIEMMDKDKFAALEPFEP